MNAATSALSVPKLNVGSGLNIGAVGNASGSGSSWTVIGVIGILAVLALIGAIIYIFVYKPRTKPREGFLGGLSGLFGMGGEEAPAGPNAEPETVAEADAPKPDEVSEGFFGSVARGAGSPDCLRVLPDAAKVATALNDGSDDARELMVLAGKMACFKKDAIGTAQVIEATRYQPFNTSHDLQPITETMSMCFSKNLPKRDLDLIFGKYRTRGMDLIHKLALSQNKSDRELAAYEKSFASAMADVSALAEQVCSGSSNPLLEGGGKVSMNEVGRVEGVTTGDVADLRPYDGYY
jgi:hypothetical protein